jgi:Uncharacterized conserved protein
MLFRFNQAFLNISFEWYIMPIDLVCGMKVKENSPLKSDFKGKTYYFCSEQCKTEFDKNPLKYIR